MRSVLQAIFVGSILCTASCYAQTAKPPVIVSPPPARVTPPPMPHSFTGGISLGTTGFRMPAVKNHPYTLLLKTTSHKKGPDGLPIAHVYFKRIMRDTEGREREEIFAAQQIVPAGNAISVRITDPVAQTMVSWFPGTKTASVTHIPLPPPLTPEQEAKQAETRAKLEGYRKAHQPSPELDSDLPHETLAGIDAVGHRHILIIPADRTQDHQEVRIVEDTWTDPELKIKLASVTDDPRPEMGKIYTMVEELKRGAPDPVLFQIPAGYQIIDNSK